MLREYKVINVDDLPEAFMAMEVADAGRKCELKVANQGQPSRFDGVIVLVERTSSARPTSVSVGRRIFVQLDRSGEPLWASKSVVKDFKYR